MTRTRLTTGFHRLGLVLMTPFFVAALIVVALMIFVRDGDMILATAWVVSLPLAGGMAYGLCRLIAWVAGGFMAE